MKQQKIGSNSQFCFGPILYCQLQQHEGLNMWTEKRKSAPYFPTIAGWMERVTTWHYSHKHSFFGFGLFTKAEWWRRASHVEQEQQHTTALPAPHPPQSSPSFLIAPSHCLVPFSQLQSSALPITLGLGCPSLDHTDIQTLFRAIRPPRSALNLHFHSFRRHYFFLFSHFFSCYCCVLRHTAHGQWIAH